MRIGLYGGSFNPIHLGHIHLLREFIRRLSLDRVLLIPAGLPPHKEAAGLAGREDRLAMCALAAAEITEAPAEVSSVELNSPGRSYTADTLEAIKALYPEDELFLLMGEDMLLTLDRWYRSDVICRLAVLCASPRSENGLCKLQEKKAELEKAFRARCLIEDIPWLPVSSTQVREMVGRGESPAGLVIPAVERYIAAHGLYRE